MRLRLALSLLTACLWGAPLLSAEALTLPAGAVLRAETVEAAARYDLPVGAFDGDKVPSRSVDGALTKRAWRIGGTSQSSYQILLGLQMQLEAAGYQILFSCDQGSCGGYDFRFGTEVIAEPDMHVDLGDYQFLSAARGGEDADFLTLLVSRSASAGFVQIIEVGARGTAPTETVASTKTGPILEAAQPLSDIGSAMESTGRYIMVDLSFATGSSALAEGSFKSLSDLAGYLLAHPEKRVALVGHTDAEGSLAGNITVSERRAGSVKERLTREYGVPAVQLEARGIGYLAPIASNQTAEGRSQNRRVEAILISTE